MAFMAHAEYRVYQYTLKKRIKNSPDSPNAKIVLSSLNPVAFTAYNGGNGLIQIDLLRTWMCPGYTGKKAPYCPSPYDKIIERTIK